MTLQRGQVEQLALQLEIYGVWMMGWCGSFLLCRNPHRTTNVCQGNMALTAVQQDNNNSGPEQGQGFHPLHHARPEASECFNTKIPSSATRHVTR